jgi:nitrate reductase NapAB chaperone NapD
VRRALAELAGVTVGDATVAGLPVVADTATTRGAEELGARLQQVPGVKAAVLVYHNFEDVADEAAPLPRSFRSDGPAQSSFPHANEPS